MNQEPLEEGHLVGEVVVGVLPECLDGREAVLQMQREGSHQWRQMEWLGWWFEHAGLRALVDHLGGGPGPEYGNTQFDYQRRFVWDLKAHPVIGSNGQPNPWAILNDAEATGLCIEDHGGIGYVIAEGTAEFDQTGDFKAWHDALKGGVSRYERERVARGARSRARKSAFRFTGVTLLFFESLEDLDRGVAEGWAAGFQEGMRNADGSPRRAKFSVKPDGVPGAYVVARYRIGR